MSGHGPELAPAPTELHEVLDPDWLTVALSDVEPGERVVRVETLGHSETHARKVRFRATVDYWDDANDVYRIKLRRGQLVSVTARPSSSLALSVVLWKPALGSLAQASPKFRACPYGSSAASTPNGSSSHGP